MERDVGEIYKVSGPVVTATGISPRMYDVVYVGEEKLMGEVIGLEGPKTIVQVYESTSGVRPGEPVEASGAPLTVELGPGVITQIYDGIQRPLPALQEMQGDFISRGATAPGVPRDEEWTFTPTVDDGAEVSQGDIIGTVPETETVTHRVMVPPDVEGTIDEIHEGTYTVEDPIAYLEDGTEITMLQEWPIREQRPIEEKLLPDVPLVTGQRILDTLFPVAKGGTAAIPGPFGSGKTVTQHQLAKWADSDVVIFIGCGERGNEMTEVLEEFPELEDPQTGNPLMERTVLIANTSNMPVAAREASVYTGITIGEYYRDQGYDVSLMADSTSRWAEALREISSRLEEMPGEEGYPAYLGAELSAFYERAGRVRTLGEDEGSVTVIGAVSPPGGDFSEPVTQNTLRIVKVFWALDSDLASRRHFPAINWLDSYSLYRDGLSDWFDDQVAKDFDDVRQEAMSILEKESELEEIVQLVGSDALPESEQLLLDVARQIREIFLQQNAFHDVDTYTPIQRQYKLLRAILQYRDLAEKALEMGTPVEDITTVTSKTELARSKLEDDMDERIDEVLQEMEQEFDQLQQQAQTVTTEEVS